MGSSVVTLDVNLYKMLTFPPNTIFQDITSFGKVIWSKERKPSNLFPAAFSWQQKPINNLHVDLKP